MPEAWIERLFQRFAMVYGTEKFASLWRTQDLGQVKALWVKELGKFSREQVARAVELLPRKHPSWPPTLFEFVDLCRPASLDPEAAFHEAVKGTQARREGKFGDWSSRAVYWAALDVSAFDLLGMTWPQLRARWIRALEARLADPNLPAIPDVPKALPEPPRTEAGDDQRFDALAALVGQRTKSKPRAWVEAIIERHAAGDKSLSEIAYRMALASEHIR